MPEFTDLTIKKMGEATVDKGSFRRTKLVAVWSDNSMTECTRESPPDAEVSAEIQCVVEEVDKAAMSFFERLGQLEREGMKVRVLYDSEEVVQRSEMGPLGSLREGKLY